MLANMLFSYTEPHSHHNTINIPLSTSQDNRVETTFIEKDRIITQESSRDQDHHKVDMGYYDEDGHYHS